jgi:ubiquinone/menaquinone biosynthesis C-methylase UbiE
MTREHGHGHEHDRGNEHGRGHGHHHGDPQYDKHRNPVDFARYLSRLEDPSREAWQRPEALVEALGLASGDVACDVGAGPGYLALRMAGAVGPRGVVYAVDVDPRMIETLRDRARKAGLRNVRPLLSTSRRMALPPRRCAVILMVNAFHHFPDGARTLARLASRLAPGGRIVVVDFHKRALPVGPPPGHKLSRAEVAATARKSGLEVARERRFLPYQFFLELVPVRVPAPGRRASRPDGRPRARPAAARSKPPPRRGPAGRRRAGRSTR